MTKFSKDLKERLIALMLYHLFRRPDGLNAYCIAVQIGATELCEADSLIYKNKEDGALRAWLELGSKVNFCLLEGMGAVDIVLMSTYNLQRLRETDRSFYEEGKRLRTDASKRWSNEWRIMQAKIISSRSLHEGKPRQESLALTWQSVQSYCARKLEQMNKQEESEQLQRLSLGDLTISANHK